MYRCLELAKNGFGQVAPNPMVGAVIVHNDAIIGEGYHQEYGKVHAEVNAVNNVKNKELLQDSTLYVNLEPCAHFGKTPPCSDLIIKHHIPRVVIGCVDSFSEVAGKGIEKLKNKGIDVTLGVLEKESLELNKRFFTFHNKKRPYIILKWAQSLDGFIDRERTAAENPAIISNRASQRLSHLWRSQEMGIMVGTNTALMDNPSLTVRAVSGNNPTRIVIDKENKLEQSLNIFNTDANTIVFNNSKTTDNNHIRYIQIDFKENIIPQVLNKLYELDVQSVIVEGGTQLLQSFIENNYWDEARVFIGNTVINKGVKAPDFPTGIVQTETLEDNKLVSITKA